MSEPTVKELRVRRYTQEITRLEALLRSREGKVERAKIKLADAKDRLELAQKAKD